MTPPEPEFRAGDRVILTDAPDGYPAGFNIVPGMTGTIDIIDSLTTVDVKCDAGQRFGVIASARHLLKLEGDDQRRPRPRPAGPRRQRGTRPPR